MDCLDCVSDLGSSADSEAQDRPPLLAEIASRYPPVELRARAFFPAWGGALTLAYEGWPSALADLKAELAVAHPILPAERPGSKWPKTTLGALKAGAEPLSRDELDAVAKVCTAATSKLGGVTWRCERISHTLYARSSHECLVSRHDLPLSADGGDGSGANVRAADAAYVDSVLKESDDLDAYHKHMTPAATDATYRSLGLGASLVAFLPPALPAQLRVAGSCGDGANVGLADIRAVIADFRLQMEEVLPGRYAWFDDSALHCTLRQFYIAA